uniref:Serine/threonine-protein kinase n=1 Tax=Rhizophora mucronata TaxID=61149 RepID=A0A2P2MHU2_RHIMU
MTLEVVIVATIAIAPFRTPGLVVSAHQSMLWLIHKTHLGVAYQIFHKAVDKAMDREHPKNCMNSERLIT